MNVFTKTGKVTKAATKVFRKVTLGQIVSTATAEELGAEPPVLRLDKKTGWTISTNLPDRMGDGWDNKGELPYGISKAGRADAENDFAILLAFHFEAREKFRPTPLDHRMVNVITPDRGIGPGNLLLMVSHPSSGEAQLRQDIKAAWDKQEEEEWESDDVLEEKLRDKGYTIHEPNGAIIHIEL